VFPWRGERRARGTQVLGDVTVVFGTQRCGSNYFLSACRRLDHLLVLGEMYHRGGAFPFQSNPQKDFEVKQSLGRLLWRDHAEQAGECFGTWDRAAEFSPAANTAIDAALVKFSHRYPYRYFLGLQAVAGDDDLIFKIFPEHLDLAQILALLRVTRPHVLLLLRNPLDSFISYKKLVETKKPQDVDTSDLRIAFNKADYFAYKASLASWFGAIKEFCEDEWIRVSVSHYEWLHGFEAETKPDKVRELMQHTLGKPMRVADGRSAPPLFRQQDKSASAAQKVQNPDQLPQQPQIVLR
jgi:hypothetical protein